MSEAPNPVLDNLVIETHRRHADQVTGTQTLVDTCERIGYLAWSAQLLARSHEEISRIYGSPDSQETFRKTLWSLHSANAMRDKRCGAQLDKLMTYGAGVLLVAKLAEAQSEPASPSHGVGYAIVRNNVSGSLSRRLAKAHAGRQPYAWIQSINVHPEYQGRGVGSTLLKAALQHFGADQKPTAYVFDENPRGLEYFRGLGFAKQPPEQEPIVDETYFGGGTAPVRMWRLEGESVAAVQATAASRACRREAAA